MNRPIAEVGRRVVVVAVDTLIPIALAGIVWAVLSFFDALFAITIPPVVLVLIAAVLGIGWTLGLSALQGGRGSPGMRLLGTRLIGAEDLRPIGFLRALVRNVVFFALCAVVIGFFTVLLDRSGSRQGWHDRVAGSIMVQRPKRTPIMPQLPQTDRRASEWLAAMSQPSMGEPERITEVPIVEANHHMTTTDPPVRHSSLITFVPGVTLDQVQLEEERISPPPVPESADGAEESIVQHHPIEETTGRRRARLARTEAIRYSDDVPGVGVGTPPVARDGDATDSAMEDTVASPWFTDEDIMAVFRFPQAEADDVADPGNGEVPASDAAPDAENITDAAEPVTDVPVDEVEPVIAAEPEVASEPEVAAEPEVADAAESVAAPAPATAPGADEPAVRPGMPPATPMPSRADLPMPGGALHGTGMVGLGAPTAEPAETNVDESTAVNEAPVPKQARTFNGVRAVATVVWDDGTQYRIYTRTVFGRNPTPRQRGQIATIVDTSLSLSKTHFEISRTENDHAEIIDLHSTNGVRLRRSGEARVLPPGEPIVLATGDIIEIGRRRARVEVIS